MSTVRDRVWFVPELLRLLNDRKVGDDDYYSAVEVGKESGSLEREMPLRQGFFRHQLEP
jgi:hypothetical protein